MLGAGVERERAAHCTATLVDASSGFARSLNLSVYVSVEVVDEQDCITSLQTIIPFRVVLQVSVISPGKPSTYQSIEWLHATEQVNSAQSSGFRDRLAGPSDIVAVWGVKSSICRLISHLQKLASQALVLLYLASVVNIVL